MDRVVYTGRRVVGVGGRTQSLGTRLRGGGTRGWQVAENRASYLNQGIKDLLTDPKEYDRSK